MRGLDLAAAAEFACAAADAARKEILPRFRNPQLAVETKADGSPVTAADRAAEKALRRVLREFSPEIGILGEEYGAQNSAAARQWVVDPIDGTISFSRGLPLFGTLIALVAEGAPLLGLIDLPALDTRIVGWRAGGVRRNGAPVQCSARPSLQRALIAHGDLFCMQRFCPRWREGYSRLAAAYSADAAPLLRGYADAFGHAQVLCGAADAMVDADLNLWDAAATQALAREAGGRCTTVRRGEKLGLVFGAPALVEQLAEYFPAAAPAGT